MSIESVCVYCGSSNHVGPEYIGIAQEIGAVIAGHKLRLVYGGGHVGLMGAVADAALQAGGEVIGIIPNHIKAHEKQHKGLTELHVVDNMHIRKSMMFEKSDAFVALPGGFGTLEELFEVLTWKQIGLHTKPILIYNSDGFWDTMLKMVDELITKNFAPANNQHIFRVVKTPQEMMKALFTPEHFSFNPKDKWG